MDANTADLLATLMALEVELHQPIARRDAHRLDALLHPGFREFGRSGASYTKADVLERLPAETTPAQVVSDRFDVEPLSHSLALLTYRSAHQLADGRLDRFTLRSSLWELTPSGWQMRFHQGTPTDAFELEASQ